MKSDSSETSASPDPAVATENSKKRKVKIDEIEVDVSQPEPPSKKAKRLLKKGKAVPAKPDSDNDGGEGEGDETATKTKGGKDKSKRSEHGVWIGNLPWTLTRADLFKWFVESSGGALAEANVTRVNMPPSKHAGGARDGRMHPDRAKPVPQNKGFAYVDFDSEAACVAAMALTETELDGRKVLIKNASSFEGRPKPVVENGDGAGADGAAAAEESKKNTSKKIYVGNLSFQVTDDDLWAHFEKCGDIDWVKVATFEDTGKCKGYGWVKFKEVEAADAAAKGFVRIKEEIPTEDDFKDEAAQQQNDGEEEEGADNKKEEEGADNKKEEKKFKTRKWWVNRLKGRQLKIEFAEDDQVRYKKRYGKDAPAERKQALGGGKKRDPAGAAGEKEDAAPRQKPPPPTKAPVYEEKGVKSYLTGSVVKPEGKKVTFD